MSDWFEATGMAMERIKSFGLKPLDVINVSIAFLNPRAVVVVREKKNKTPKYEVFPDTWSTKTVFSDLERKSNPNWTDLFDVPFPDSDGNNFCSDPNNL